MSYTQQQAEIDPYMQLDFEGSQVSHYPEVSETYLPSAFSNCPTGTDQNQAIMQVLQETHPQYGRPFHEGSSGV
jgi:hypothetical protein